MKKNGFNQKKHCYQITSYVLFIAITFFDLTVFILQMDFDALVSIYVLYTISSLTSIVSTFICTYIDPTDDMIILQLQRKKQNQQFDFVQFNLNLYCDSCDAYVSENSKHCKRCNRCSQKFDHHCKWINNCVGDKNYKSFLVMLCAVFVQFSLSIGIHSTLINKYNSQLQLTIVHNMDQRILVFSSIPLHDTNIKFGLCIAFLIPTLLFALGLLQLIVFHVYLVYNKTTTYSYILAQRQSSKVQHNVDQTNKVLPIPQQQEESFERINRPENTQQGIDKSQIQEMMLSQSIQQQQKVQKDNRSSQGSNTNINFNFKNDKLDIDFDQSQKIGDDSYKNSQFQRGINKSCEIGNGQKTSVYLLILLLFKLDNFVQFMITPNKINRDIQEEIQHDLYESQSEQQQYLCTYYIHTTSNKQTYQQKSASKEWKKSQIQIMAINFTES